MTCETFRYCWLKVTDEDGRAAAMRSALDLQQQLMERAHSAAPGSPQARAVAEDMQMARCYLGEAVDHGVRVVIYPQHESMTLQVLADTPACGTNGVEIAVADMPAGYTREQAQAWLTSPVGSTWSQGALACRLIYAVATVEEERDMVAPPAREHTLGSVDRARA